MELLPDYTEWGITDRNWLSQDGSYRSPTPGDHRLSPTRNYCPNNTGYPATSHTILVIIPLLSLPMQEI